MGKLRCGYAECNITPSKDISLEGYEYRGTLGYGNSGVLDDLYAKALYLSDAGSEILLVVLDVCEMTTSLARSFSQAIQEKTGIPSEAIAICCTHTHSGPILDMKWGARDLDGDERQYQETILAEYLRHITNVLVSIAKEAQYSNVPSTLVYSNHKALLGYNRRKKDKKTGSVKMLYSLWENPGVEPDGVFDENIPILLVEREHDLTDTYLSPSGPDRIVLINPAFHPVVLGQHSRVVSADYPGVACRYLEQFLGTGTKAMCILGASGDTHPFISTQTNPMGVTITGMAVAAGVASALTIRRKNFGSAIWTKSMQICIDPSQDINVSITAFAIGAVVFLGISAECFVELGLLARKESPFDCTILGTLTNGSIGYIPSADEFQYGEYEVTIAMEHGIGPETLSEVAVAIKQLVLDLYAEVDSGE